MIYGWFHGRMDLVLYLIGIIIVIMVNRKLQATYSYYRDTDSKQGKTGYEVARAILDSNNLQHVEIIKQEKGILSDFFDPRNNTVSLSPDTYQNTSIASISVAAHEVGHAIQHSIGYKPIDLRNRILPFANIASNLSWIIIIIGLLISRQNLSLLYLGIFLLGIIAIFQIVTLPIEFNASRRAVQQLVSLRLIDSEEENDCKKMLHAAALTYVAAVVNSMIQVLRIILISNNRKK